MGFWNERRVLVTGGCGLIGGELCSQLVKEGAWVFVADPLPPGTLGSHHLVSNMQIDATGEASHDGDSNVILWRGDASTALFRYKPVGFFDALFHLAAVSHVEQSRSNPIRTFDTNSKLTWDVLEAARHAGVKAVLVPSSNHVYGPHGGALTAEDAPMRQLDIYSASKACQDIVARAYAHNYGLPVVVARNTNCFGPYDPHTDHIVPSTILSVMNGKRPVLRTDGTTKKAYLYVGDVADSFIQLARWQIEHPDQQGEVFNVTGGQEYRVTAQEMVRHILRIMDAQELGVSVGDTRLDQADENLDATKIRNWLGWEPQWSLDDALRDTIAAFRAAFERKEVAV
jgi:CDP-glucose 4,6-dehydratase